MCTHLHLLVPNSTQTFCFQLYWANSAEWNHMDLKLMKHLISFNLNLYPVVLKICSETYYSIFSQNKYLLLCTKLFTLKISSCQHFNVFWRTRVLEKNGANLRDLLVFLIFKQSSLKGFEQYFFNRIEENHKVKELFY